MKTERGHSLSNKLETFPELTDEGPQQNGCKKTKTKIHYAGIAGKWDRYLPQAYREKKQIAHEDNKL